MKFLRILFAFIMFTAIAVNAQPPGWNLNLVTATNHTILVQSTASIDLDGNPIESGDFIGVFFDSLGNEACAGYMIWTGVTNSLTAWGADQGNDGFASGEVFKWKVYDVSAGTEYTASASYDFSLPQAPNDSTFAVNGISALASLSGYVPGQMPTAPNWSFINTGSNHTILVMNTVQISIDGTQIVNGDYLGLFFDDNGTLECGGYIIYDNSGNMSLSAYGDDGMTPAKDGFDNGEAFQWIIWQQSTNSYLYPAIPTYNPVGGPFTNTGNFAVNGISGLASLTFTSPQGPDLAVIEWLGPFSTCDTLTNSEAITIEITNQGNQSIDSFAVSYSIDGGLNYVTETVMQLVNVNDTIQYTFTTIADLSVPGTIYDCFASVFSTDDLNGINDTINMEVGNYSIPAVTFQNLQTNYCLNDPEDTLIGVPSGGTFFGTGIYLDLFYPTVAGTHDIMYVYSNPGCTDTAIIQTTVNAIPNVDFGAIPANPCPGDTIVLSAPSGLTYNWSNGTTDMSFNVIESGTYSVTATDINGCFGTDEAIITYVVAPDPNLGPDQDLCVGESVVLDAGAGSWYFWNDTTISNTTQSITVTNSGTYWVDVQWMGCIGQDTITLTFHDLPQPVITGLSQACEGDVVTLSSDAFPSYNWNNGETTQAINVTSSGTYVVTVTDSWGCEGTDNFSLVVNPIPVVEIEMTGFACTGTPVTLGVDNIGAIYLWDDLPHSTTQTIDVTENGTYSVTVTENGCDGSDSYTVEFDSVPTAGFTFGIAGMVVEMMNTSSANSDSYLWDFGDGNTSTDQSTSHTYAVSGTYTISLTAKNECGNDEFTEVVVITNIFEEYLQSSLQIIPNPNNGNFRVQFDIPGSVSNFTLKMTDIVGKVIFEEKISEHTNAFIQEYSFDNLPSGIYNFNISNSNSIFNKKIIVE